MASINNRVTWIERQTRKVGTLIDLQKLSDEAVIETDDGLRHIIALSEIEQPVERIPENLREQ